MADVDRSFACEICTPQRMRFRGCSREGYGGQCQAPFKIQSRGVDVVIYDCPANRVPPAAGEVLRLYGHWSEGRLAYPGGLRSQAAKYVAAMEIIGSELSLIQRQRAERNDG